MAGTFTDDEMNEFIETATKGELLRLKLDLGDKVASIKLQLEQHANTKDVEWLRRARAAATITGRQMARIDLRISELTEANNSFHRFFQIAQERLDLETFTQLKLAAGM